MIGALAGSTAEAPLGSGVIVRVQAIDWGVYGGTRQEDSHG